MKESVIYQDILQKGNKQGEERVILLLLNRRFKVIDESLIERVRGLSTEQLENLAEALLDFTAVADLEAWLNQQEHRTLPGHPATHELSVNCQRPGNTRFAATGKLHSELRCVLHGTYLLNLCSMVSISIFRGYGRKCSH